ncbi:unnamed protein product [Pleuronectes platessa]|uniref:Uncharacterized protein n=1 Tax=Pleuronectes platessa TaxID=8262 RepID=A0A9N7TXL0_PLEPL|nr:unnamed protein product [Pleuronectes platessa]
MAPSPARYCTDFAKMAVFISRRLWHQFWIQPAPPTSHLIAYQCIPTNVQPTNQRVESPKGAAYQSARVGQQHFGLVVSDTVLGKMARILAMQHYCSESDCLSLYVTGPGSVSASGGRRRSR